MSTAAHVKLLSNFPFQCFNPKIHLATETPSTPARMLLFLAVIMDYVQQRVQWDRYVCHRVNVW